MKSKLVINVCEQETRVALLEDGTIAELYIERQDESDVAGNIYKGRVQRVLPGMQAAFVDVGMRQAAFIYVDDVIGRDPEHLAEFAALAEDAQTESLETGTPPQRPPIEELIREGQEIMVQVAKSPIGTKGARVTSHISLPGRFLVFMPASRHVGVSRRMEDEAERTRLREMVSRLRTEEAGYIVRTAAEGIEEAKITKEMAFLTNLWGAIRKQFPAAPVPALLHRELTVSLRAVRDLLTYEADQVMVDDDDTYRSILSFLETFMPTMKESVERYEGREPIFDAHNLEGDISRALKRKVWLKSGGYVVIEHTEALVAIDVNTGRYVGKHNLEETILKTNLEAVKEIAYQIRLRDIGGIIIIDFIDMQRKSNQEKVFNALREAARRDRSKTHILPMSDMGLIQMTRKRVRKPLKRMLCEPCFYCDGEGYLMSGRSICYSIYREVMRDTQDVPGRKVTIRVNPDIAELLHGEENGLVLSLERNTGKQIVIYPNPDYHLEEFDLFETLTSG